MNKAELIKEIYSIHLKQLNYLDVPHKKLAICFSGIAGSGKTHIAKILEEKYKGVRIRNDDIRNIIHRINKDTEDIDALTYEYLSWFYKNNKFKNGLIILDSGIERKHEELFSFFKKEGYKVFIIRLKVSEKVYEQRIKNKLGQLDQNYIDRIDDWKKQYKEFGKKFKPDILIENEKDGKLDLEPLFRKLDKLLT